MSSMYINYDGVESYASTIAKRNDTLLQELHKIQEHNKSLSGEWESDSAVRIREKITGMEPRFQQYYDIVDNYVKLLRNTVQDYKRTESTNTANADQFI